MNGPWIHSILATASSAGAAGPVLAEFTSTKQAALSEQGQLSWLCCCERGGPKFLRQTFHEFAAFSVRQSVWSKAFYEQKRKQGKDHHAAVRALAFKWIRILYRCWQDSKPYEESCYLAALERSGSALFRELPVSVESL